MKLYLENIFVWEAALQISTMLTSAITGWVAGMRRCEIGCPLEINCFAGPHGRTNEGLILKRSLFLISLICLKWQRENLYR
jgi:hypothetical protein